MIQTDDDGPVRTVTLRREDKRNALTPSALESLAGAITASPPPVVRLRGAGEAFSAGADFETIQTLASAAARGDTDPAYRFARAGQQLCAAIERSDTIVVGTVDGPARGGGMELALACDLRVGTPRATFGEPGVRFGLFGAWGGTQRLIELVGQTQAFDLALSGRTIGAETARSIGLLSRVTDDPAAVVAEIGAHDPTTLEHIHSLLAGSRPSDRSRQHEREANAFASLVAQHASSLQQLDR
ncbi:enoyl-CoA hydratase/isomerase family protein [Halocatena halophila]|uniref:enoyl-CoA hydratase/isomerase family protein n=1 Tax=Halocatena halophila TaxID=2814576 RepID=UPI002ED21DA8